MGEITKCSGEVPAWCQLVDHGLKIILDKQHQEITPEEFEAVLFARALYGFIPSLSKAREFLNYGENVPKGLLSYYSHETLEDSIIVQTILNNQKSKESHEDTYKLGVNFATNQPIYFSPSEERKLNDLRRRMREIAQRSPLYRHKNDETDYSAREIRLGLEGELVLRLMMGN